MHIDDELLDIIHRVWSKLQDLPRASPLDVGAFSVLVLFAGKLVLEKLYYLLCLDSKI